MYSMWQKGLFPLGSCFYKVHGKKKKTTPKNSQEPPAFPSLPPKKTGERNVLLEEKEDLSADPGSRKKCVHKKKEKSVQFEKTKLDLQQLHKMTLQIVY